MAVAEHRPTARSAKMPKTITGHESGCVCSTGIAVMMLELVGSKVVLGESHCDSKGIVDSFVVVVVLLLVVVLDVVVCTPVLLVELLLLLLLLLLEEEDALVEFVFVAIDLLVAWVEEESSSA
jgi:hypothetical protein